MTTVCAAAMLTQMVRLLGLDVGVVVNNAFVVVSINSSDNVDSASETVILRIIGVKSFVLFPIFGPKIPVEYAGAF